MKDPILGIKFRKKASKPQVPAKSTPSSASRIQMETPVAKLKIAFTPIYRLTLSVTARKCPRGFSGSGKAAWSFPGNPAASIRIKRTVRKNQKHVRK